VHGRYKDYDAVRERAGLYDQLLAQTQTDSERAAAEAEERAYNAAMGSVVPRLVRAEFRAAAKGVLDDGQLEALIEDVDLTKYVSDDGEPDLDKIGRKIKAVAPKAPPPQLRPGQPGDRPGHHQHERLHPQAGRCAARITARPGMARVLLLPFREQEIRHALQQSRLAVGCCGTHARGGQQ
jgi:hypothetical protein